MAELFRNFEVNQDVRWPALLKFLGGSLGFHLLVLVCVMYVPGVRDAFNIAVLFADTKFVDKDYNKTEIGDDVQLVELTRDKFRYPDGYFALEGQAMVPPPALSAAQIIAQAHPAVSEAETSPSPDLSQSPSPIATPLPSPPSVTSSSPAETIARADASPTPATNDEELTIEQAQKKLEESAAKINLDLPKEDEINKKALKDFLAHANELKNQGKLDLDKAFEIVIEAELDQNGKLKNARFTRKAGDPNLVELFGHMVSALNDSGLMVQLKPLYKDNPGSKVVFTVKQGESEVLATVGAEASSAESARVLSKGFNVILAWGASSRKGKDEEVLLRNTSASPVGKTIVFNLTLPRQSVVELLKKHLPT